MLKVGDIVGGIYPNTICGKTVWYLEEDEIVKVVQSKNGGKYHVRSKFRPLDIEEVDDNTQIAKDFDMVFSREVFHLNKITRKLAEEYVGYMNQNHANVSIDDWYF